MSVVLSALVPILFDTVVAKLGSSPSADASSFNVFSVAGDESTRFETSVSTYDRVAMVDVSTFSVIVSFVS